MQATTADSLPTDEAGWRSRIESRLRDWGYDDVELRPLRVLSNGGVEFYVRHRESVDEGGVEYWKYIWVARWPENVDKGLRAAAEQCREWRAQGCPTKGCSHTIKDDADFDRVLGIGA